METSTTARLTAFPNAQVESREILTSEQRAAALDSSDGILLSRVTGGDTEALGLLFTRYARPIRSIGRRILRDDSEADDFGPGRVSLHPAEMFSL